MFFYKYLEGQKHVKNITLDLSKVNLSAPTEVINENGQVLKSIEIRRRKQVVQITVNNMQEGLAIPRGMLFKTITVMFSKNIPRKFLEWALYLQETREDQSPFSDYIVVAMRDSLHDQIFDSKIFS